MATSIKAVKNVWGNYGCFVGASKEDVFGDRFDATDWVSDKLRAGDYVLSAKSDVTQGDVDAFRARIEAPIRRVGAA